MVAFTLNKILKCHQIIQVQLNYMEFRQRIIQYHCEKIWEAGFQGFFPILQNNLKY